MTIVWLNTSIPLRLKDGDTSIEEFNSRMRKIEEGMKGDPDLQAFAMTLQRRGELRLASETYLDLARPHALYGGNDPPPPKKVADLLLFYWMTS